MLKLCQSGFCKKSQEDEQNEQDSPVYVDPATLPMSQGCNKDPLNYIDVHVLPTIQPGGMKENMPIYVDPDTVVSSREKLRENRGEINQAFGGVQAAKSENDDRVYQAPDGTRTEKDVESESKDERAEEEIRVNAASEATETHGPPITQRKPRANTEPMLGYQDLDSSDEIEENFYHSLHTSSEGESKNIYYVNERVLSSSLR